MDKTFNLYCVCPSELVRGPFSQFPLCFYIEVRNEKWKDVVYYARFYRQPCLDIEVFFNEFCCVCQVKDKGLVNDEKTDEEEAPQQHDESVIGIMETIFSYYWPFFHCYCCCYCNYYDYHCVLAILCAMLNFISSHSLTSLKLLFSPAVPASKSYTVAIIKPDAVAHGKANEIIMKVHRDQHCSRFKRTWLSQAFLLTLFHYVDMTLDSRCSVWDPGPWGTRTDRGRGSRFLPAQSSRGMMYVCVIIGSSQ